MSIRNTQTLALVRYLKSCSGPSLTAASGSHIAAVKMVNIAISREQLFCFFPQVIWSFHMIFHWKSQGSQISTFQSEHKKHWHEMKATQRTQMHTSPSLPSCRERGMPLLRAYEDKYSVSTCKTPRPSNTLFWKVSCAQLPTYELAPVLLQSKISQDKLETRPAHL